MTKYFYDLLQFNLEGLPLLFTIWFFVILWVVLILWVRFVIFKWVIRVEGREWKRGWDSATKD